MSILECNCNEEGSEGIECNDDGHCKCRCNVIGDKCDTCADNFYGFPLCYGIQYDFKDSQTNKVKLIAYL